VSVHPAKRKFNNENSSGRKLTIKRKQIRSVVFVRIGAYAHPTLTINYNEIVLKMSPYN
jgi:hypothetical protein